MKMNICIPGAAVAAVVAAAILPLPSAAVDVPGRERGRLAAMSQKSFEDLRDLTDRRIAEIRATPNMSFTVTSSYFFGTNTRYVSAAGNDSNDGQTPETAWKTIDKVNGYLGYGVKYVCFRRGDVFRGTIKAQSGITYTAYGDESKPKPCIYVSPENGAVPNKWQQTDAPNVWKYNAGTNDVGTIVFDGGRAHAIKIVPERHTNATDTVEFTQLYTGEPFTNSYKDLAHDLHFWHDYTKTTRFKKYAKGDGTLYLYSEQNPGVRFKSIEFCPKQFAFNIEVTGNVTIDNLCIKYCGAHAIGAGSSDNPTPVRNLKITNCEFGWIGGSTQNEYSDKRNYPVRYGNAVEIYGGCDGYTVDNCYIYQVYDAAITHQFGLTDNVPQTDQKNISYANNVIECCNYSIEYFLSLSGRDPNSNTTHMENISIVSNIMWDAGIGFCQQRPITNEAAHIKSWQLDNRAKNFSIRDNVFARSTAMLVQINSTLANSDGTDSMPKAMSGNVFIGNKGQRLGVVNQGTAVYLPYDNQGVGRLCERYADNYFLITPRRKYSLSVVPPGPHLER